MNINGPSFDEAMKSHQICLSEDLDSLNDNGMIFFRDDNVEIGDSMNSILTVYQPLFDARDLDLIDLYVHPDDKRVLHHVYPKVPSFMYRDHDKVHKLERSEENPEVYWFTKKKHKRLAFKIVEDNDMKLETSEYRLPFELSTARVDSIENSSTKLMKNYRTFTVKVDENIYHTVAYVFWKIIIEGKTANFSGSTNPVKRNLHADAKELEERSIDPPGMSYSNQQAGAFGDGGVPDRQPSSTPVPDKQSSSMAIPFLGDVTDGEEAVIAQTSNPSGFSLQPVLQNHIASFGRYVIGAKDQHNLPISPNKKQKVHNNQPMDEDFIDPDL